MTLSKHLYPRPAWLIWWLWSH